MLFTIFHTGGEFIVRTDKSEGEVVELIQERWDIEIEEIAQATPEDIKINEGQITELDTDL
jgi:hypothetical protein